VRWRARHGQGRDEVSRTFDTERAARDWLATVVADQARGTYIDHRDGRRLLVDWAAEWQAAQLHAANTAARVDWALQVHILPSFGDRPLSRITRLQVQQWVRQLSNTGYAAETVASLYSVLGSVLAAAVDEGLLAASPCRRVQLPRKDAEERPFVDEHQGLAIAERCGDYGLLVVTALFTGCRWGELVGLRRHNCQLLHKRLRIVESLHETAGSLAMGPPKTAASRRDVLLPPFLVDLLAAHLGNDRAPANATFGLTAEGAPGASARERDGVTSDSPPLDAQQGARGQGSSFVFTGPRGALLRRSNFARRIWAPAVESIKPGLHLHDLRHSHRALLMADGVPEFAINRRMGHARRTISDSYSHVLPVVEKRMLEALQARWDGAQAKRRTG
jgi:integrase